MQHTDLEIGPTLSARLQTQLEEQFNHVSEYKRGFESFLQVLGKKLKQEEQRGRVKGVYEEVFLVSSAKHVLQ